MNATQMKKLLGKLKKTGDITREETDTIYDIVSRSFGPGACSDSLSAILEKWYMEVQNLLSQGKKGIFIETIPMFFTTKGGFILTQKCLNFLSDEEKLSAVTRAVREKEGAKNYSSSENKIETLFPGCKRNLYLKENSDKILFEEYIFSRAGCFNRVKELNDFAPILKSDPEYYRGVALYDKQLHNDAMEELCGKVSDTAQICLATIKNIEKNDIPFFLGTGQNPNTGYFLIVPKDKKREISEMLDVSPEEVSLCLTRIGQQINNLPANTESIGTQFGGEFFTDKNRIYFLKGKKTYAYDFFGFAETVCFAVKECAKRKRAIEDGKASVRDRFDDNIMEIIK